MNHLLPEKIITVDKQLHHLLQEISFSKHLNPCNAQAAQHAFLSGKHTPPFEYIPLQNADEILTRLDQLTVKTDHPAMALIHQKIKGIRLLTKALHHRTAESFDQLNRFQKWYPTAEVQHLRFSPTKSRSGQSHHSARELIYHLRQALQARKLHNWTIVEDTVMSARVLVDGSKCILRVNPVAKFRSADLQRLVVHEIDVHAMRSFNGSKQPLHIFQTGLPHSLLTEEGLAMVAEQRSGVQLPGTLQRQCEVIKGIELGRHLGFRELYEKLRSNNGAGLAWTICLRLKRGLAQPELPGVYAKDSVYLSGWYHVDKWLAAGNDIRLLYVGEVGIQHPIQEWLDQGWIELQDLPDSWNRSNM